MIEPRARVLYLHGGGCIHPLTEDYWRFVRDLEPVEADLSGLPPIHVLVGCRDILRPAVDRLADRVRGTEDATLHVHERTAMFHVWMTRFLPEARATRQWLRSFVIRSAFLRSE